MRRVVLLALAGWLIPAAAFAQANPAAQAPHSPEVHRAAADAGDLEAVYAMGDHYLRGEGVAQDYAEAIRWFLRAAEKNHAPSQVALAVMHYNGEGVPKNPREAAAWYSRAGRQGNAAGQYGLGLLLETGEGVPLNPAEAERLYRLAAQQGHAPAKQRLAAIEAAARSATRVSARPAESLSVERASGCFLQAGAASCWGHTPFREPPDEEFGEDPSDPALIGLGLNLVFRQISVGDTHACGLTSDGKVYCWGEGHLGSSTALRRNPEIVAVGGNLRFRSMSAGPSFSCAVERNGTVYCWGYNAAGLGRQSLPDTCKVGSRDAACALTPVAVEGNRRFREVSVGSRAACMLSEGGELYCWGTGVSSPTGPYARLPVPVGKGLEFRSIDMGGIHGCGVTRGGEVYCWGSNTSGQLGVGDTARSDVPVRVPLEGKFAAVSAGSDHTCALDEQGTAYCWGRGGEGQLGSLQLRDRCPVLGQSIPCSRTPLPVGGGFRFSEISAGNSTTCALTGAGARYCWGYAGASVTSVPPERTCRTQLLASLGTAVCDLTPQPAGRRPAR